MDKPGRVLWGWLRGSAEAGNGYHSVRRPTARAVMEAETWEWEEFGEAVERDFWSSGKSSDGFRKWGRAQHILGYSRGKPSPGMYLSQELQDYISALCRWCGSAGLLGWWPSPHTGKENGGLLVLGPRGLLPQARGFKYLGVLFRSDGRMEWEMDRQAGVVSVVMRTQSPQFTCQTTFRHTLIVMSPG